ncbi:MAG: bifunctional phosphopantothenoylcysteine decarboxylase/phosphopantothenate--cysteine ligase CoaBC [Chloroflexi bacterium]|nr:bifunctional phosphopantothenoylcysteine decarboxylase/phosphopantothenate--cysteine ligase CoaBC [Chloroflexota bacterium]
MLEGKHIVLGVTGGIAAYKAVELCSSLIKAGAEVQVVMTPAAVHFVGPLTFQTLTARPVSIDTFQLLRDTDMAHISLSAWADVLVIAPATANTIAKLVHGIADNLLLSTALACPAPLVVAPAMDADMYAHPSTQANLRVLAERGATIVGPDEGRLASGRIGRGRLVNTSELLAAIRATLGRQGALAGTHVLVTAGGTREPLDPVRHLGNRSSGKMGYALAEAARDMGAKVTLVHANTQLPAICGIEMLAVETATEMHQAVLERVPHTDLLIMAAAVADYRPVQRAEHKIKKDADDLTLQLERTLDILQAVADQRTASGNPGFVVGFAAETQDLIANAQVKLAKKRLDLMVANDVSGSDSGFEVGQNRVILLQPDGKQEVLSLMPKSEAAEHILARVVELWRRA